MKTICCSDNSCHEELVLLITFLKIIADENRLKILCILLKHGEKCVCEIWQYLAISQNLASHHLKVLKQFGLLTSRKDGLNIFYSINHQGMNTYKGLLNRILTEEVVETIK
jgi:ArsR family transcriptional regulator